MYMPGRQGFATSSNGSVFSSHPHSGTPETLLCQVANPKASHLKGRARAESDHVLLHFLNPFRRRLHERLKRTGIVGASLRRNHRFRIPRSGIHFHARHYVQFSQFPRPAASVSLLAFSSAPSPVAFLTLCNLYDLSHCGVFSCKDFHVSRIGGFSSLFCQRGPFGRRVAANLEGRPRPRRPSRFINSSVAAAAVAEWTTFWDSFNLSMPPEKRRRDEYARASTAIFELAFLGLKS